MYFVYCRNQLKSQESAWNSCMLKIHDDRNVVLVSEPNCVPVDSKLHNVHNLYTFLELIKTQ
jgi:hypothetical protein